MKSGLIVAVVLMLLSFVLLPVSAKSIGPTKAQNNPNIMMQGAETVLLTPGGVQHEWRDTEASLLDYVHILNASKVDWHDRVGTFSLADLITLMTNPEIGMKYENKWIHITQNTLFELLKPEYGEDGAQAIASMWPDGMYIKYVNVGK